MNPQRLFRYLQGRKLIIIMLVTGVALSASGIASCAVESAQDEAVSKKEEREFKSTIPEHVPIKVKVKNEQSFKKMDNDKWARELEIEVKNTGSKPIYFIAMVVKMPEMVNDNGYPLIFAIHYGRSALVYLDTPLQPEDTPIRPGESITLKVSENQTKAFEAMLPSEKVSNPRKIELDMQYINFGDGTGFRGRIGRPYLPPRKKQAASPQSMKGESNALSLPRKFCSTDPPAKFNKAFQFPAPANFLRVDFSPPDATSTSASLLPCNCQNSNGCICRATGGVKVFR